MRQQPVRPPIRIVTSGHPLAHIVQDHQSSDVKHAVYQDKIQRYCVIIMVAIYMSEIISPPTVWQNFV